MSDDELDAMSRVLAALIDLNPEAQERALAWVSEKLGVPSAIRLKESARDAGNQSGRADGSAAPVQHRDFADLFDAARPSNDIEKALVAGYWVQFGLGNPDFGSQSINDELKQLGHPVGNITRALSGLIEVRPALVQQLRKDGGTKQARKTYRLTNAGQRKVEAMCSGRSFKDEC